MSQQIIILDYNAGNIQSVRKKLQKLDANVVVTNDPNQLQLADKIILPGVGHFGNAMQNLQQLNLIDALNELVLVKKKPILGICLGMQVMAKHSEEGNAEGLGWIDGEIVRFQVSDQLKYKVPHMGWNTVTIKKESALMKDIPEESAFYFVHSYHFKTSNPEMVLNETTYDYSFVSAFEQENIFGVQYHPEKSHDIGEKLIANFISL